MRRVRQRNQHPRRAVPTLRCAPGGGLAGAAEDAVEPAEISEVLDAAIRAALRMAEGDLTPEQLAKVESLKLDETDIGDLAGLVAELKSLPNLKMLGLKRTGVADATPLIALGGLRYLYLEKNQITAAAPLCELKQLKQLWLFGNPLPREEVILIEQALPKCEVFI